MRCEGHYLFSTMASSNGDIFRVTGPLWMNPPVDSLAKVSYAELWRFLWCAPEQTIEQRMEMTVIWDAMISMWRHCDGFGSYGYRNKRILMIITILYWQESQSNFNQVLLRFFGRDCSHQRGTDIWWRHDPASWQWHGNYFHITGPLWGVYLTKGHWCRSVML